MKILVVHNRYQQAGGEDSVVKHEIEMLQQHSISVELLAQDNDDIHTPLAKIQAAFSSIYSFHSRELVSRKILAFGPDVVHVHNFFPKFSPSIYDACVQRGVPVVQTLHNYRSSVQKLFSSVMASLARSASACHLPGPQSDMDVTAAAGLVQPPWPRVLA